MHGAKMSSEILPKRCAGVLPDRFRQGLTVLLEATEFAKQTNRNVWEFAVELDLLSGLGLSLNDFRLLVRKGLVEHQREVTLASDDGRAFRPTGDLTFPARTCFVLTDLGVSYACEICGRLASDDTMSWISFDRNGRRPENGATAENNGKNNHPPSTNGEVPQVEPTLPKWDSERRVLSLNGTTVKQFKWTAENQEAILCAFEEEGWRARIDDPLPPHVDQDSKRRLSDTIKCLNRKQNQPLIHFRGDGTGEGVVWELVDGHNPADDGSG